MAAEASTCPNCLAETLPDDQFCQDCGAVLTSSRRSERVGLDVQGTATGEDQAREKTRAPTAEAKARALLTCLNCGCRHDKPMRFCGSCGSSLSDMGVYTTHIQDEKVSVRPAGGEAAGLSQRPGPDSVSADGPAVRRERSHLLDSPLFQRSVNPADFRGSIYYEPPAISRPFVDLSIGVLLLAFFGMLIWWLIDLEKGHSPFSVKEALVQAKAAVGANHFDQGIHILETISLEKGGKLDQEERAALDDALYMRALAYADKGNYRLALADLLRISPDFMQYDRARKKVRDYSQLAQSQVDKPAPSKPDPVKQGAKPQKRASSQRSLEDDSLGPAADSSQAAGGESAAVESGGSSGAASKRRWNYTDDDVARYNKLLADYFSVSRLSTRRHIKEDLGVAAENREPPAFKEWLDRGKPDF